MAMIKLEDTKAAGTHLHHLTFSVPHEVSSSFKTPGQYIVMNEGEEKGFFAIASLPGSEQLEFLIKNQGGLAEKICQMKTGETIEASEAQGNGFDMASASGKDVHLFSMGSGIAPFRSFIQWKMAGNGNLKSLCLWQASFTKDHLPFVDEYASWQEGSVKVFECLDEGGGKNLHDTLNEVKPDLASAMCYWIGSKPFGEEVAKTCIELGLPENNLKSNY